MTRQRGERERGEREIGQRCQIQESERIGEREVRGKDSRGMEEISE